MSWDWLNQTPTAVVGVVGIAATVWAQHAERRHADRAALETRSQDRRQATYERLLKQAIEVTEFVGYADVIFVRDYEPPDVDVKSYDAWLVLDLYASTSFAAAYRAWQAAVATARDVLDEVPPKKKWYEVKGDLPHRFELAKTEMDRALAEVVTVARTELGTTA